MSAQNRVDTPSHDRQTLVWGTDRVFVTPAQGCPASCVFCYLPSAECDAPQAASRPTDAIVREIMEHPAFRRGADGTLISIGCLSEALAPHAAESTIALLGQLVELPNRVQLATRWVLQGELLEAFVQLAKRQNVTVYNSFATLVGRDVIERGTPSLDRRRVFMQACSARGVRTILYIKPFLPGVTVLSKEAFGDFAEAAQVRHAVIGPLYVDERIAVRVSSLLSAEWRATYFGVDRFPVGVRGKDFGSEHPEVLALRRYLESRGLMVEHHGWQMAETLKSAPAPVAECY